MYGDYFNPYNYSSNNQWQNPINRNRQEIIKVNGKNGAEAYQMMPNSQALLLDETAPVVWLVQTDGAGYKTISAFDLTPHEEINTNSTLKNLEERLKKVEEQLSRGTNNVNESNSRQTTVSRNNPIEMLKQFNEFKRNMQGKDPQKIVMDLLNSGRMSQQQFELLKQQAQQLQNFLK